MKKRIKEANDSWGAMLPVNNNKGSIPVVDLAMLKNEEDLFRVFDISAPKSLEILGKTLMVGLMEYHNPIAPLNTLNQVRVMFNRIGYDFDMSADRVSAFKNMENGFVDFPLTAGTSALYPYQIDQTYPGYRVEDDGIEKKLGYKLVVRIHAETITDSVSSTPIKILNGEIVPQE